MKAICLKLHFPYAWVLEQYKNGNRTVVESALKKLQEYFAGKVTVIVSKDVQSLCLLVASEQEVSESEVLEQLKKEPLFGDENAQVEIEIKELDADQLKKLVSDVEKKLTDEEKAFFKDHFGVTIEKQEDILYIETEEDTSEKKEMSLDEFMQEMVGIAPLEDWVEKMTAIGKRHKAFAHQHRIAQAFSYVISINRGNGLSSILELMKYHMVKLEFLPKHADVIEHKLSFVDDVEDVRPIGSLLERMSESTVKGQVFEGIVAVALDEWLDHLYDKRLDILLDIMWKSRGKTVFVFTLPYVDDLVINKVCERVDDVLTVWKMRFAPVSDERYFDIFCKQLKKADIEADASVKNAFISKIIEEKNDGKFYGFNTVKKIVQEVLYHIVAEAAQQDRDIPKTITGEDFEHWYKIDADGGVSGLEQLAEMIGLHEVKEKIREILSTAKMQKNLYMQNKDAIKPCNHMMFAGSPGTGKTVVARIIGRIFKEEGLLSVGHFFEVSRQDFVGKFVGHTAPKTMEICRNAYGSVLFIDEAYLLAEDSGHGFGSEAIGTLIAAMENQRDDMVVIFAGYEDDLEKLFEDNAGLRDRIPHKIVFPNYNRDELKEIFFLQLRKGITVDDSFRVAADKFFAELPEALLQDRNFSNGRFVRNLAERMVSKAAMRYDMENVVPSEYKLTESDFSLAVADADYKRMFAKPEQKRNRIGF